MADRKTEIDRDDDLDLELFQEEEAPEAEAETEPTVAVEEEPEEGEEDAGRQFRAPIAEIIEIAFLVVMGIMGIVVYLHISKQDVSVKQDGLRETAGMANEAAVQIGGEAGVARLQEAIEIYPLSPFLVVVQGKNGTGIFKVEVACKVSEGFRKSDMERNILNIRQEIYNLLRKTNPDELESASAKMGLKDSLLATINGGLERKGVVEVYFTQFSVKYGSEGLPP